MIYSTPEFLFLFLIGWIFYARFAHQKFRQSLLLVMSFCFIAWAGFLDAILLLIISSLTWALVSFSVYWNRRGVVIVGAFLLLLNLLYWKYYGWLASQLGLGTVQRSWLPVGVSFYTLQGLGYLFDFGRGKAEPVKWIDYLLFKGLFAQLIAGPIARGHELIPQLKQLPSPRTTDLSQGICLFVLGFLKKILIADRIAPHVDRIFQGADEYSAFSLWMGGLAFTVQIWADFSGYTDMGRGIAKMLGINLPENFRSPYFSRGPSEFWRRWHITLSQWIRDYLYTPLALYAMRRSRWHFGLVIFITMAVVGLWHGANWTMVLFGVYHGLLLVGEHFLFKKLPEKRRGGWSRMVTLALVMQGFILFRSDSLSHYFKYLSGMFAFSDQKISYPLGGSIVLGIVLCFLIQAVGITRQRYALLKLEKSRLWVNRSPQLSGMLAGLSVGLSFLLTLFFRGQQEGAPFIYFQF